MPPPPPTTPPPTPSPREAPVLPAAFTASEARAAGISRRRQLRMVAEGWWVVLAPGCWCTEQTWSTADRRSRAVLAGWAQLRRHPKAVLSHTSAAAVWGWPLPLAPLAGRSGRAPLAPPGSAGEGPAPGVVELSVGPGRGSSPHRSPSAHLRVAQLEGHEVVVHRGLHVTSRARTAVDCARVLDRGDAVAVLDAAGRDGVRRSEVQVQLDGRARWPGSRQAREALRLADPRRESWLESVSAVVLDRAGLPPGEPQVRVLDRGGRLAGRVDLLWQGSGLVGEADGKEEYRSRGLTGPRDLERELHLERRREQALRDLGLDVVRWSTAEALDPGPLVERVRRALEAGRGRRTTAVLRPAPRWGDW